MGNLWLSGDRVVYRYAWVWMKMRWGDGVKMVSFSKKVRPDTEITILTGKEPANFCEPSLQGQGLTFETFWFSEAVEWGHGERHQGSRQGSKHEGYLKLQGCTIKACISQVFLSVLQATAIFAVARPYPKARGTWETLNSAGSCETPCFGEVPGRPSGLNRLCPWNYSKTLIVSIEDVMGDTDLQ